MSDLFDTTLLLEPRPRKAIGQSLATRSVKVTNKVPCHVQNQPRFPTVVLTP